MVPIDTIGGPTVEFNRSITAESYTSGVRLGCTSWSIQFSNNVQKLDAYYSKVVFTTFKTLVLDVLSLNLRKSHPVSRQVRFLNLQVLDIHCIF